MRTLTCKRCGQKFGTEGNFKKYCPECAKAARKEHDKKYESSAKGRKRHAKYVEKKKQQIYEEVPEELELPTVVEDNPKEHYCGNYDPTNITCINCYADTTAQYRGCYKKIGDKK